MTTFSKHAVNWKLKRMSKERTSLMMVDISVVFPGCKYTFAKDGQHQRNHELKHDPPDEDVRSDLFFEDKPEEVDDMFNYQKALMEYGMIIANLRDAIS